MNKKIDITDGEEFDLDDFERLLLLKNQLILLSKEELRELFSDVPTYLVFVDNVSCLLNKESAFLYLSKDFLDKIEDVIMIHRFDLDSDKLNEMGVCIDDVHEVINAITLRLNDIANTDISERRLITKSYIEDIRNVKFSTVADFGTALSYDAPVYFSLTGEFDKPIRDDLMRSSIYYFMVTAPDIFHNNEILKRAEDMTSSIYRRSSIFDMAGRKLSKQAKQKLKSLFREE